MSKFRPIKVENLAPLIQVFDMPTAVAFYRDILGFTWSDNPSRTTTSTGAC